MAILLVAIPVLYFLYTRRKKKRMEDEMAAAAAAAALQDDFLPVAEAEEELTPEQIEELNKREAIENMAKSNPEDVAQLIRTWLAEE